MARLQFKESTLKKLFALACNQCAFDDGTIDCQTPIVDKDEDIIGEICHIESANPQGQRYNPESDDEYRRSFENLILFCSIHHKKTDNVAKYDVEVLRMMKDMHQKKFQNTSYIPNDNLMQKIANFYNKTITQSTLGDNSHNINAEVVTFQGMSPETEKHQNEYIEFLKKELKNSQLSIEKQAEEIQKLVKQKDDLEKEFAKGSANEKWKEYVAQALKESRFDDAISLINEGIKSSNSSVAEGYFEKGKIYHLKLDFTNAIENVELACKLEIRNIRYQMMLGDLYFTISNIDKAIEVFEKIYKIENSQNEESFLSSAILNNLGLCYVEKGKYKEAIYLFENSIRIATKLKGLEYEALAASYANIGLALRGLGEYDKAIDMYDNAISISNRRLGNDYQIKAVFLSVLGLLWNDKGEYEKALKLFMEALNIDKRYFGEEHPNIATRLNNIGMVYYNMEMYDECISYTEKAISLGRIFFNEEHSSTFTTYGNLATAYSSKHDVNNDSMYLTKASYYNELALTIGLKIYGSENPNIAMCYNNIGSMYYKKKQYEDAMVYYKKAISIIEKVSTSHSQLATFYNNLGNTLRVIKQYESALDYINKALSINRTNFGIKHSSIVANYSSLGLCFMDQGKRKDAIRYFEYAKNLSDVCFGRESKISKTISARLKAARKIK